MGNPGADAFNKLLEQEATLSEEEKAALNAKVSEGSAWDRLWRRKDNAQATANATTRNRGATGTATAKKPETKKETTETDVVSELRKFF